MTRPQWGTAVCAAVLTAVACHQSNTVQPIALPASEAPAKVVAPPAPPPVAAVAPPRQEEGKSGALVKEKGHAQAQRDKVAIGGLLSAFDAAGSSSNALGGPGSNDAFSGIGDGSGKASGLGGLSLRGSGRGGGGHGAAVGYGYGGASAPIMGHISYGSGGMPAATEPQASSEGYKNYGVNGFTLTEQDRLSTFSVDVDTASYAIARRKILEGHKPPPDSVRVEEFLNYFHYDYPSPKDGPLTVQMDAAPSPFQKDRTLLRVGVQGKRLSMSERKPAHLTFLVDVSGSMMSPDKLPLAKRALRILVDNLRDGDTVALVTYAGGVKDVLPPTGLEYKARIYQAIEDLRPGGSTAMASGIELAYRHAAQQLGPHSNSRVIIMSDGDANVGPTSQAEIMKLIAKHVKEGVTLSVVGFGMGNYKDDVMEQLADKGNGNYFYCDSVMQAKRIFQEQLGGTLEVIAKDVKLQVEFDPNVVKKYRLVGYENRDIADQDFRNDKVDAGEVGSGHTVTALYELELADGAAGKSLATVHLRAKPPTGETAAETTYAFQPARYSPTFEGASKDLHFAAAVMGAAEIFRGSVYAREWSLGQAEEIARKATDPNNAERMEFVSLLGKARELFGPVATR